ncbi:MAG: phage terminase large subunit family protein [Gemmatimonadaceae bacterium]|nr:phage terminase large subunit family protein [Gemmatimonadaceae bacterium]
MAFVTHPEARRKFGLDLEGSAARILQPPPELKLSEWAEQNRILGPSTGSTEQGPYRLSRVPYLREILEEFSNPEVREMVILKSARLGVTDGLINNAVGYCIDLDPGNILALWPTKEDAQEWSKETLPELFELTTCLRGKVADTESRNSDNTILHKRFAGGWLSAIGSNSPRALRRRTARYVFVDEYDALDEKQSTQEGDVGRRAARRADTNPSAKIIFTGSPRGRKSRIIRDYLSSDQREYFVPCPHCRHLQPLTWDRVQWEKEKDPKTGKTVRHFPETAHYLCRSCEQPIREGREKRDMITAGEWVAKNPGASVRGWKITTVYSLFVTWGALAEQRIKAKRALEGGDAQLMIEFYQQVLAEYYEATLDKPDTAALSARRETYAAPVPAGVGVLTAAVDVQDDRLELLVKGWGVGQESWDIAHHRIYGDPEQPDVWKRLDLLLFKPFAHELGAELRVRCTFVDSGFKAETVYAYTRRRRSLGVWPVKGEPSKKGRPLIAMSKAAAVKERLWLVDESRLKATVLRRLKIELPPGAVGAAGYVHFPGPQDDGLDDDYLAQFENEVVVPKELPSGTTVLQWKVLGPNEAIDLQKYALAALHALGDAVVNNLSHWVERAAAQGRARGGRAQAKRDGAQQATDEHSTATPRRRSRVRHRGIE